ncbi:hypothetical protein Ancab_004803 [Ancistrocladus abbreviatus]
MELKSFIEVQPDSHFPIQNLPYGVFKPEPSAQPRPGVAVGDYVLDLSRIASAGLFDGPLLKGSDCFLQPTLNKFAGMGRLAWKEARATIQNYCHNKVEMLVPVEVGDYTDFFSSLHHASNCATIFRGKENLIPQNWFYLPIAYHGRASSILVSGTDISQSQFLLILVSVRGQRFPAGDSPPSYGPTDMLDFELEMAAIVGPGNELGKPIDVNKAADHIFGLVLLNDWSARDIQHWEYVPLGPFLGKSFGTTISPWIVTLEALEPFACDAPKQDPPPMPYLTEKRSRKNYDISLEVQLKPVGLEKSCLITKTNFKYFRYWTLMQQLAHHTVNGCNLRPGDLLGTGTLSGPEPDSLGCLLEITWHGQKPLSLNNGTTRQYLEDGDEVVFTGFCKGDSYKIGFGTCSGKPFDQSYMEIFTCHRPDQRKGRHLESSSSRKQILATLSQQETPNPNRRQFTEFLTFHRMGMLSAKTLEISSPFPFSKKCQQLLNCNIRISLPFTPANPTNKIRIAPLIPCLKSCLQPADATPKIKPIELKTVSPAQT